LLITANRPRIARGLGNEMDFGGLAWRLGNEMDFGGLAWRLGL
jgi:hypothetical protein